MESIGISKYIVNEIRNESKEHIWGFFIRDGKVDNIYKLHDFAPNNESRAVITFANIDFDGFIHNHFDVADMSDIDEEYYLPNIVYIIISPEDVKAYRNLEELKCVLY